VGGIISGVRHVKTKKGDRMAAFMLEDLAAAIEVVVFPEAFRMHGALVENDQMVLVRGKLERTEDNSKLVANEISLVSSLTEKLSREVAICLTAPPATRATFEHVADILMRHRGDRRVRVELDARDLTTPMRVRADLGAVLVRPSEKLVAELEQVAGVQTVKLR
jgi:DNA polymerase-3 subunit alpha